MGDTVEEFQKNMKNRNDLMDTLHDSFICNVHNKRILNWEVKSNYMIRYKTCCKEFSDIIDKELSQHPLT